MTTTPRLAQAINAFTGTESDLLEDIMLSDQGWQQVTNGPELLEFRLAVIFAAVLKADHGWGRGSTTPIRPRF